MSKNNIQDELIKHLVGNCLNCRDKMDKVYPVLKHLLNNENYDFINKVSVGFNYDKDNANELEKLLKKNINNNVNKNNKDEYIINMLIQIGEKAFVELNVYRTIISSYLITNYTFDNIDDFFNKAEYIFNKVFTTLNKKNMIGGTGVLNQDDINQIKYLLSQQIVVNSNNRFNNNFIKLKDEIMLNNNNIKLVFNKSDGKNYEIILYKDKVQDNDNIYINYGIDKNKTDLKSDFINFNQFITKFIFLSNNDDKIDEIILNFKYFKMLYALNLFNEGKGYNLNKLYLQLKELYYNTHINTLTDLNDFKKKIDNLFNFVNNNGLENPIKETVQKLKNNTFAIFGNNNNNINYNNKVPILRNFTYYLNGGEFSVNGNITKNLVSLGLSDFLESLFNNLYNKLLKQGQKLSKETMDQIKEIIDKIRENEKLIVNLYNQVYKFSNNKEMTILGKTDIEKFSNETESVMNNINEKNKNILIEIYSKLEEYLRSI